MASSLPASYNFLDLCTTTGKLLLILPVSCSLVTFILTAKLSSFLLALSTAPSSPHPHVPRCSFQSTVTSLSAASLSRDPLLCHILVAGASGSPCGRRHFSELFHAILSSRKGYSRNLLRAEKNAAREQVITSLR